MISHMIITRFTYIFKYMLLIIKYICPRCVGHFFFECGHFGYIMHTWRASGCLITIHWVHIFYQYFIPWKILPLHTSHVHCSPKTRAEALAQTWKLSENWEIRSEGTAMRRTSRIQIQLEGWWNVIHLGRGSKLMQNLWHSMSMVYLPTIYRRNYPSYR